MYKRIFEEFAQLLIRVILQFSKVTPDKGVIKEQVEKIKILAKQKEEAQNVIDQQKEEMEKLKESFDAMQKELEESKQLAENSQKEVQKLKELAQQDIEQLKLINTDLQAEITQLKEASSSDKNEISLLSSTIQNLETQVKSKQAKHQTTIDELHMQLATLEEENQRYLAAIIRHSKDISFDFPASVFSPQHSKGHTRLLPDNLKELIYEIYASKPKHDKRRADAGKPRTTLEEYMYVYLEDKCGGKQAAVKWADAVVDGVGYYADLDADIMLFGKMLQNRCDEDYRLIHLEVKATVINLLGAELRKKHPQCTDERLLQMLSEVQKCSIAEGEWKEILRKMYNEEDVSELVKGMEVREGKVKFSKFVKAVLEFQLAKHEKYLEKFVEVFNRVDKNASGVINSTQFKELLEEMKLRPSETEIQELLERIDPQRNESLTFSECVSLFTCETLSSTTVSYTHLTLPTICSV
eukprot:TRINITY_DN3905_c0_g4_i1.p1 TRINITY_DN3905_c0_g4~~TRINITY_DN3905_c0_g4_i1.p1  ORF type:complete len:468 (+),score=118.92 TRINITY_DN3905_c0_g4_i1:156-1559(+)